MDFGIIPKKIISHNYTGAYIFCINDNELEYIMF